MNLDNPVIGIVLGIVVDADGHGGLQFTRIVTYDALWGLEDWIGFPWNVVNARIAERNDAYERARSVRMLAFVYDDELAFVYDDELAFVYDDEEEYR